MKFHNDVPYYGSVFMYWVLGRSCQSRNSCTLVLVNFLAFLPVCFLYFFFLEFLLIFCETTESLTFSFIFSFFVVLLLYERILKFQRYLLLPVSKLSKDCIWVVIQLSPSLLRILFFGGSTESFSSYPSAFQLLQLCC